MTKGRRASLLLLAFAAVAAAVVAVYAIATRPPPLSPLEHIPTTWKDARETPMHVFHVGTKKIACGECHSQPDASPNESACTKCHEKETKRHHHGSAETPTTCLSCHVFGANKSAPTCNDCHTKAKRAPGAPALDHHASADLPCGSCHSIHADERAVLADCTTCHQTMSAAHGAFAVHARPDAVPDASMDLSMDAAVLAFVREAGAPSFAAHERDASSADLAHAHVGDPHQALPGQVCTMCHAPHTGKEAAKGTCEGCHVTARTATGHTGPVLAAIAKTAPHVAPRGPRVAGHEACVTCHEPHRARKSDVRGCEGCHGDHRGVAAVRGHSTCTGCHTPHAPKEARASCSATCHANVTVLAAQRVPAHAECASCHDPHRPEVSAGNACVRCHSNVKPSHPPVASAKGEQACTGCHAPHGGRAGAVAHAAAIPVANDCTSCHKSAKDDHAFHAGKTACTACHAPHGFRLAGAGAALCAKCHDDKAKATTSRPGHANCTSCHGSAHAPVAKPACASCHADQAKTAPKGHSACTSCHDAHSGSLGTRATCTSCHENKANALHAKVGQGCATCHRPHALTGAKAASFHAGDAPPACASCHAKPSLKGLHGAGGHATCANCHVAHGPPRSDRATCTSTCHTDRKNHQPEAQVCKGCHLFKQ